VGIACDEDGMIVDQLEEKLKQYKPALVYTIPSYHNPTGYSMSTARRQVYRNRVEAMNQALIEHLGDIARWQKPQGGYFFWLEMPEGFDAAAMRQKAPSFKTGFEAGSVFSSQGQFSHYIRLSFAHYNETQIDEGVARLAGLFKS